MNPAEVSTPSDTEVRVSRSFDAAVQIVWQAYTDPKLVQQWMLGPPGWSMPVCDIDFRVGGTFEWRWRNTESGEEFAIVGAYQEIVPHARIVHTEEYRQVAGGDAMGDGTQVTVDFQEESGVTIVTTVIRYSSKEARDAALETGMTDGMEMSYKRLDDTVGSAGGPA